MKQKNIQVSTDHFPQFIENLVIFAIIGVVIHTVIDDLAVINHWSHDKMLVSTIISFIFDLFFTIEFIGRAVISSRRTSVGHYIRFQRGWIDAISSFPLLLLVSGPALLMFFSQQGDASIQLGFLSILKSAKAIRVTRILRLIRVIKLFGKIQNTDSPMTNRHIGMVSTIATVTLVVVLVITNLLPATRFGDQNDYLLKRTSELNALLATAPPDEWLVNYVKKSANNSDIISLKAPSGKIIYKSQDKDLHWTAYTAPVKIFDYEILLSDHIALAEQAKANMMIFFAILGIIFAMMFIYAKIFAQQVTDPLFVMNKGLRDWNYNLTVKDNEHFAEDEVYRLAAAFNRTWLPFKTQIYAKKKKKMEESQKSVLKMDDIF